MPRRHKMTRRQNRKNFRRGNKIKSKNYLGGSPMRGGIRL